MRKVLELMAVALLWAALAAPAWAQAKGAPDPDDVANVITAIFEVPERLPLPLERIRGAADDALAGGVAVIGELHNTPELLATTDDVIKEVANGAVRYAGPVSKLLG